MHVFFKMKKENTPPFFQFAVKTEMELLVAYKTEFHVQVIIIIDSYIARNH